MSNRNVQIVWYKRDLRIRDHAPLNRAALAGDVLPLYIVEPAILSADDMDAMHFEFIRDCLESLRESLTALGAPLIVKTGEAVAVFESLAQRFEITAIHCHEETGNALTFARDKSVLQWARARGIDIHEVPNNGVVRRLGSRDGWASIWAQRMHQDPVEPPGDLSAVAIEVDEIPDARSLNLCHLHPAVEKRQQTQIGGEGAAWQTLESFVAERGHRYQREISAPAIARRSCSRLSPYIAYGVLSIRQIVDYVGRSNFTGRPASAFISRLHWHCHFIQKLESEPDIEFRCFNPLYETLRGAPDPKKLIAWQQGRTGYPFVDACIRSLQNSGWINFRMRAMLTSFAAYDLWLDWRSFRDFLARQFIDYEPGIHISQLQMQSGVTGINTPRMYNPVKQGYDHDPAGEFIREWVPELANVPTLFIHEPWKMSPLEIAETGMQPGTHYPMPIVDHQQAIRHARAAIAKVRNSDAHGSQADAVFVKHGSRKRSGDRQSASAYRQRRGKGQDGRRFDRPAADHGQLSLFE
ncbi:MAG: deoxyribodipyrimidine photo-lyase [Pseudomonadota bacterium]